MKSLLTVCGLIFCSLTALAQQDVFFQKACERGDQFVISAVGDILLHGPLQKAAAQARDFSILWDRFTPYFQNADMAYANLEGPAARGVLRSGQVTRDPGHVFDDQVYTSYARFNYHPSLITSLVRSGFDILSTANNHSVDRNAIGIDRTIEALESERHNLSFVGTRKTTEREEDRPWYTLVDYYVLLKCAF